jgi:orotate phosphoribosyltransferase
VTDTRAQLIEYIRAEAVFHGDFVLTSGKKATYYVDLRKVSLDHRVAPLIGSVMLDLIAGVREVSAVGGMTMGADPIAAAVLHQGAARGLAYDAFVVRKEPKDHGRGRQVEGPELQGKRVIVLEDTSTTGGSPLSAIAALEKVGAEIAAVAVVVDRDTGAREKIEAAGSRRNSGSRATRPQRTEAPHNRMPREATAAPWSLETRETQIAPCRVSRTASPHPRCLQHRQHSQAASIGD